MPTDLQGLAAFVIMLCHSQHLPQLLGVHEEKRLVGWQFCAILSHKHTVWCADLLIVRGQVAKELLLGICHAFQRTGALPDLLTGDLGRPLFS